MIRSSSHLYVDEMARTEERVGVKYNESMLSSTKENKRRTRFLSILEQVRRTHLANVLGIRRPLACCRRWPTSRRRRPVLFFSFSCLCFFSFLIPRNDLPNPLRKRVWKVRGRRTTIRALNLRLLPRPRRSLCQRHARLFQTSRRQRRRPRLRTRGHRMA